MSGKLFFLIGIPRSGKSTYCEKWVDNPNHKRRVIVSSDSIRMAMHGQRYEPLAETMVFAVKHIMIRSLLSKGFDVIVDGTHSTKISIQRLLEIDPNATPIFLQTPVEVCKERAIKTNQPDLIPVIDRIADNIDIIKTVGLNTFISVIKKQIAKRGLY